VTLRTGSSRTEPTSGIPATRIDCVIAMTNVVRLTSAVMIIARDTRTMVAIGDMVINMIADRIAIGVIPTVTGVMRIGTAAWRGVIIARCESAANDLTSKLVPAFFEGGDELSRRGERERC
jgi:hypothetical protein